MSSPKWVPLHWCPQRESQLPPASSGGSLTLAGGSDMGSFEMTVSLLGLGAYGTWHAPFKNKVTVSYSPPVLPYASLICLQSLMLWGFILMVQMPVLGAQCRAQKTWFLGRSSAVLIILQLEAQLPRDVGLDNTMSLSFQHIPLWFLLYIFICGKTFLLVFRWLNQWLLCK